MANAVYLAGPTITIVDNTDLESDDASFPCLSTTDSSDHRQTDYTDIRDAITANPGGSIGSGTAATGLNVSGDSDLDGAVVINDAGADKDSRVESANDEYMLFLDAGNDVIGIKNSTPATDLEIDITGRLRTSDAVFYDEFWAAQGKEWATKVTTGSVAAQSKDNGWIRLTTGATNTDEESLDWGDVCPFANTKLPTFECRIQLEQVTVLEAYFGLMEASGGSDDDYIWIGVDAYSQNTWFCEASNAGSATTDMGAVADTNEVELRFILTSDTAIEWFIDGVSQGVVATNVPTAQLQPVIMLKTQEAGAHYVDLDYVKIWQDRT